MREVDLSSSSREEEGQRRDIRGPEAAVKEGQEKTIERVQKLCVF